MAKKVETANLIDLSFDEQQKPDTEDLLKMNAATIPAFVLASEKPLIEHNMDLFNNNPFDCIQHLSNQPIDPFECVEQEAYNKLPKVTNQSEIKMAKLLSLSDDNLLDEETESDYDPLPQHLRDKNSTTHNKKYLDGDSDDALLISDSGDNSGNNTDSSNISSKTKKALEYRKRLLKLSISNSTLNSPVGRHMTSQSMEVDLTGEMDNLSPLSSIFMQAAQSGEESLAAESPLKFVDDDLLSEDTPNSRRNLMNAVAFDADLEMLNIPILKELPSPVVVESPPRFDDPTVKATATDLAALRARLCKKQKGSDDSDQSITSLIQNLKTIIRSIDVIDDNKKVEASALLETLSSTLGTKKKNTKDTRESEFSDVVYSIKREGAFDLDMEKAEEETERPISSNPAMIRSLSSSSHSVQSIPDVMVKSSGTYNGEPTEERDYVLPKIEPISPPMSADPHISDIVEQIAMLLEQHQLTQPSHCNKSGDEQTAHTTQPLNPTFIVVMNTSTQASSADLNESALPTGINESFGFVQPQARRRSHSLSTHDKIKIVQVSLPGSVQVNHEQQHDSPPLVEYQLAAGVDGDFKTPIRPIRRRNSFSNSTPSSTSNLKISESLLRRPSLASESTKRNPSSHRLGTHHEDHQQTEQELTRPLPLPKLGFNTFKPDLKRKPGHSYGNSIMASTGPLKATIPIKKVAPMMKTSTQYQESDATKQSLSSGKMAQTSTPMPSSRRAGFGVSADFPSACSTPAIPTSPIAHNKQTLAKPRYSYAPTTPTGKSVTVTSAAASGVKRRSLIDVSAKIPMRPRAPSAGSNVSYKTPVRSSSASRTATGNTKSKPVNKSATIRPTSGKETIVAPRKNKENKGP